MNNNEKKHFSKYTMEDIKHCKIFVGTPMYGGQCFGAFTKSMGDLHTLCSKFNIDLQTYFLYNESLVQRARNYIVDEFLRSDSTHLLFIDSDILFNAGDVFSLLAIQQSDPDKYGIMVGSYPKKTIAWDKVEMAARQNITNQPSDLAYFAADFAINILDTEKNFLYNEPLQIKYGSTGFMLIPREVFDKFRLAYPEQEYYPDHVGQKNFDGSRSIFAYFDCIIDKESKRYLSEDFFFCDKVQKIGIDIYTCPWIELGHFGSYLYKGSIGALSKLTIPTNNQQSTKMIKPLKRK